MRAAIDETERRRSIQDAYNQEHGIVPKTIIKGVREILEISKTAEEDTLRAHKKRKLTGAGAGGGDRQAGEGDARGQQDAGIRVRRSAA